MAKLRDAPNLGHIQPREWSYLAGLFDGEGCIRVRRHSGAHQILYATLYVSQTTCPDIITWIHGRFGGKVYVHRREHTGYIVYRHDWAVRQQNHVRLILRGMMPYLIGKKDQAELVLAFPHPIPEEVERGMNKLHYQHRIYGKVHG